MSDDKPVHFPADPEKFEFDEHVAEIFPDMADRSIPIYRQMHKLHAKILVDDYIEKRRWPENGTYRVLDIGASRADFLDAIKRELDHRKIESAEIAYLACDKSLPMVEKTEKARQIIVHEYDLADPKNNKFESMKFDAVCMHLVMQFIPVNERDICYTRLSNLVKREGLLFWGEKETLHSINWWTEKEKRIADSAHDFYIDFRMENGYSRAEIEAKTKALKNSMWEVAYESDTKRNLERVGFHPLIPTTRLGVFHSFVAIRGRG